MNSKKVSVVSNGGSVGSGVVGGVGGGAVGGQRRTTAFEEDKDPMTSRKESKALDGWRKRESAIQDPPSRKESRIQGVSGTKNRRESSLQESIQQQQQQQQQQRSYALRPSRTSLHQRHSVGGSYRSGIYSNATSLRHVALENTFRLNPRNEERFCPSRVEKVLEEFLANYLAGEQYDAKKCAQMAIQMSDIIKEHVKKMDFRRHKLSCHVIIGQKLGQGIQVSSRCLWDSKSDGSASATFSNSSLFAVATVHAVYYE